MKINTVKRNRLKFEDGYTYLGRNMIMDEHPEHIYKSLLEYFKKDDLHSYPDMWKPYEKLSNYLNVSEEKLLITRGVEGAFKQVFETLVDKGDYVVRAIGFKKIIPNNFKTFRIYLYNENGVTEKMEISDFNIEKIEDIKKDENEFVSKKKNIVNKLFAP